MPTSQLHENRELRRAPLDGLPAGASALERARNWLALGLLLAAWNAAHDDTGRVARPDSLRSYALVSVRAVARSSTLER